MRNNISFSISLPVTVIAEIKAAHPDASFSKILQRAYQVMQLLDKATQDTKQYLSPAEVNSVTAWTEAFYQSTGGLEQIARRELKALGFKFEPFAGEEE